MQAQPESFRFKAVAIVAGWRDRAGRTGLELVNQVQACRHSRNPSPFRAVAIVAGRLDRAGRTGLELVNQVQAAHSRNPSPIAGEDDKSVTLQALRGGVW